MTPDPFDQACRYAARLDPSGFLCWALGLTSADVVFRRWLDTRLIPFPNKPERITDTVAHLENVLEGLVPWLLALEFQGEPDPEMFGRLLIYLGTLWLEHKPVAARGDRFQLAAVVVNLTGRGRTGRRMRWMKAGVELTLGVQEHNLETISAGGMLRRISAGGVSRVLLCFIPLMRGGSKPAIIRQWKRLADAETNARRRADYGGVALVLAEKAGCADVCKTALQEWNVVQSKQVLEWQAQAALRARVETLLIILEARFGPVPADLASNIGTTQAVGLLKNWVRLAAQATSLDDFRQRAQL